MSLNFVILYSATVFIASLIPGPSMLLALTHGMQYGTKRNIASAMGNITVSLIQALISIAGLGTVLIAVRDSIQHYKIHRGCLLNIHRNQDILFGQHYNFT